jgi:hypothetical protein
MSNPFKPHASNLFADRESIDAVMIYVNNVINSMEPGQDRIAATTAIMILVNTAAKLWPEAPAQVEPEISDLEARFEGRIAALEESLASTARVGWTRDELVELTRDEIEAWADDNFNNLADDWLRNHADIGQEVETWMENNMDIENEVREVLSNANLSITF